ncbi:MAG: chemotaxis-specific protein-glutamate methyltransferase CheB [Planctomycetes bacterium]|nr:chemotaxis-specific protein-glutamate methyltransferase CheB [Planctomycetota bacterium]
MGIRVLVVEDSLTIRRYLADLFASTPGFEVVGEADNGKTAIELCQQHRPDIITMDMMLPVMTGVAATEYIMAYCPTPILIVSASTNRGELFKTYDALAAGAVDVLDKPSGDDLDDNWARELLSAVRVVSKVKVITHPRARLGALGRARETAVAPPQMLPSAKSYDIAAIGASTGGPGAVLSLLGALPKDFALPILLVIHISERFGAALAEWLDGQTGFSVRYAVDGERLPEPGQRGVIMAPPGYHLEVRGRRLALSQGPERHSCRPSVDVMFESLSREMGARTAGVLLTGMGRDGAAGLLDIRRAGGLTIAQDEKTSIVWGMPGEAVHLGAASHVLPLGEIGPFLATLAEAGRP